MLPFIQLLGGLRPPTTSLAGWWHAREAYSNTACTTLQSTDGGAVAGLKDLSGNGRHLIQSTGANQPLYKANRLNGNPSVLFDGSNDSLGHTAAISGANAYAVVFKMVTWANITSVLANNNDNLPLMMANSTPNLYTDSAGSLGTVANSALSVGVFGLAFVRFKTGLQEMTVNTTKTSASGTTSFTAEVTLGAAGAGTKWYGAIEACEVLHYAADLQDNSGDGLKLRQYLNMKYALGLGI